MVDFIREFTIGINFVEIVLEWQMFFFFILRYRKSTGKESKYLRNAFGYFALFFSFARICFIIWHFYIYDNYIRYIAWGFGIIAALFPVLFFMRVILHLSREYYRFGRFFTLLCILIIIISVFAMISFIFLNEWYLAFSIYLNFILGAIFLSGIIFYLRKWLLTLGKFTRKKMSLFLFGVLILSMGYFLSSIQSNFFINVLELKVIGHLIFILGLLMMASGVGALPSLDELDWKSKISELYVISKNGINLLDYHFQEKRDLDVDLISGGIVGITMLVQQMTESKNLLNCIQQEGANLLLEYGDDITIALISENDLQILHEKMGELIDEIEFIYHDMLKSWGGEVDVFKPISVLIEKIFNQ
jgi:hypothetical protein